MAGQITGLDAVMEALEQGVAIDRVLVDREHDTAALRALCEAAEVPLEEGSTNDLWRIDRALHELQAGVIKINAPTTGTELHAPFGGDKASSGHAAREQGDTAVDFFTRTRTAYIRPGRPV